MEIKNKEPVPVLPGVVIDLSAEEAELLCEYFLSKKGLESNESRASSARANVAVATSARVRCVWKIIEKLSALGY